MNEAIDRVCLATREKGSGANQIVMGIPIGGIQRIIWRSVPEWKTTVTVSVGEGFLTTLVVITERSFKLGPCAYMTHRNECENHSVQRTPFESISKICGRLALRVKHS